MKNHIYYIKQSYKNEISCQAVYNKTGLDPIPHELKDLKS